MDDKKKAKRMQVKPFVRFVNFNHIMPTRYNLDISERLVSKIDDDSLVDEEKKNAMKKAVKLELEERYKNLAVSKNEKSATGVQYFFKKLKF
jgi:large subunit ribosomal protein L27e